jgi:GDP-L-fucose synthase
MKKRTKHSIINIGSGKDYSIDHYAKLFAKIILKNKKIYVKYDKSKPDGTLRKVMDVSLAKKYGWSAKKNLNEAIMDTYNSFLKEIKL